MTFLLRTFCFYCIAFASLALAEPQEAQGKPSDSVYVDGEFAGTIYEVIAIHTKHTWDDSYTQGGRIYREFLEPRMNDAGHWRYQLYIDGEPSIVFTALLEPVRRLNRTWLGIPALDAVLRPLRDSHQKLDFVPTYQDVTRHLFIHDAPVFFGQDYEAEFRPEEIVDIQYGIDERLAKLETALEDDTDFKGLYGILQAEQSLQNNEQGSRLGVHWELLNDGWRESKRTKGKSRIEAEFDQLQMRADLHNQRFDAQIYEAKTLRNRLRYFHYKAKLNYFDALAERKQRQLEEKFITATEYDEFHLRRARAYQHLSLYRTIQHGGVLPFTRQLLNQIEALQIRSIDTLMNVGRQNSLDLRRIQLQVDRTEYYPDYWDNASLRLYVEHRDTLSEIDSQDQVAGVRLEVPIDFNRTRSAIVNNQKHNYQAVSRAIEIRMEQNLRSVRQQFYERAAELDELLRRRESMFKTDEALQNIAEAAIGNIEATPEKDREILNYNKITNAFDILEKRVDCYQLLVRLAYLTNSDVEQIIDFHLPVQKKPH